MVSGPLIHIDGQPLMLFNFLERKFILFGVVFWPHDFYLFAILMITGVVMIALFTVIFGRLFCGWVCPQTIFMELVFRKIEYWIEGDRNRQKALSRQEWNTEKIVKRTLKHGVFFLISFFIANVFLAYFIGIEGLLALVTDNPLNHVGGLISILVFSGLFYGVFAWMREQVCTVICPYGRLQGVLLDRKSIVIAYDHVRGEQRGPVRKGVSREEQGLGDCIDCDQCVQVCPTGIDIRHGTQLECVNCTACIDACDHIMDKIEKPRGLIRYSSADAISEGSSKHFGARAWAYTAVLAVLMVISVALLLTRSDVEATIMRVPGTIYQKMDDGRISNLFDVVLINKTNKDIQIDLRLIDSPAELKMINHEDVVKAQQEKKMTFMVLYKKTDITAFQSPLEIEINSMGIPLKQVETTFIGPTGSL